MAVWAEYTKHKDETVIHKDPHITGNQVAYDEKNYERTRKGLSTCEFGSSLM
jgi:hypothetical protein